MVHCEAFVKWRAAPMRAVNLCLTFAIFTFDSLKELRRAPFSPQFAG
jgi:hypothetical protein